ncbi:hypothetical protein ACGFRB_08725 [Streptomyces sp. NPDC048718]|uniref:hypothetical protein n=1 Tax=Streptomyces sp. NPDC048718 TaxID=3365587 RepID=UPI003716335C
MPTGAGDLPGLTENDVVLKTKIRDARDYAAKQADKYDHPVNDTEIAMLEAYRAIVDVLGKVLS